ncbi:hypothetical protein SO802_020645 [Lithocarpus litseifolius]|uniref:Uncharacterized protein n=1 Tax=Lithocarpus litseifolius TaxID=425828 RepID=A0AAW2CGM9_9ROSI
MAVLELNDLEIGGQLMDPTQLLQETSSSERGASGRRNHPINLRSHPYPLDKDKAINLQIMARHYTALISPLTIGEVKILLTPHGDVTDTTLKPPLKYLQRLGKEAGVYIQSPQDLRRLSLLQRVPTRMTSLFRFRSHVWTLKTFCLKISIGNSSSSSSSIEIRYRSVGESYKFGCFEIVVSLIQICCGRKLGHCVGLGFPLLGVWSEFLEVLQGHSPWDI